MSADGAGRDGAGMDRAWPDGVGPEAGGGGPLGGEMRAADGGVGVDDAPEDGEGLPGRDLRDGSAGPDAPGEFPGDGTDGDGPYDGDGDGGPGGDGPPDGPGPGPDVPPAPGGEPAGVPRADDRPAADRPAPPGGEPADGTGGPEGIPAAGPADGAGAEHVLPDEAADAAPPGPPGDLTDGGRASGPEPAVGPVDPLSALGTDGAGAAPDLGRAPGPEWAGDPAYAAGIAWPDGIAQPGGDPAGSLAPGFSTAPDDTGNPAGRIPWDGAAGQGAGATDVGRPSDGPGGRRPAGPDRPGEVREAPVDDRAVRRAREAAEAATRGDAEGTDDGGAPDAAFPPCVPEPPPYVNYGRDGVARRDAYLDAAKRADEALRVGVPSAPFEADLVRAYGERLRDRVAPAVRDEVAGLAAAVGATGFDVEVATPDEIVTHVREMTTTDAPGARPDYQVGDMTHAVRAHLTVPERAHLAPALTKLQQHLGTGDHGRILAIHPTRDDVPLTIATPSTHHTYELRIHPQRA